LSVGSDKEENFLLSGKIKHALKAKSINQKIHVFLSSRLACLKASLESEHYKGVFKNNHWRFSKKVKFLIVFVTIIVMLVSVFAFLAKPNDNTSNIIPQSSDDPIASPSPISQGATDASKTNEAVTNIGQMVNRMALGVGILAPPKPHGIIESAQTINSTVWMAVAANAWQYFQPGVGVDSTTGLPGAGLGYPYFTDWDLGVYIQAVIDANKTGLIGNDGAWGSTERVEKVVSFLENRKLNDTTHYPFWFYQAKDGQDWAAQSDLATGTVDVVDTGRLFVALNNLRAYNSSLEPRIIRIVTGGNPYPNYYALVKDVKSDSATSTSIYAYYVYSGFAAFWPEVAYVPGQILDNILKGDPVKFDGGITLPKSDISCEPLLHSIFELPNNTKLMELARNVSLAHEAKSNATRQYWAFSEGNSPSNGFIWEWVVTGSGETWKITQSGSSLDITPVFYNKVAFSFLALYNTTFARNMVIYLEQSLPDPTQGYCDGADNSKNLVSLVGSNTNGLILSAARYAMQNNPQ
jgi:hypothetical protein